MQATQKRWVLNRSGKWGLVWSEPPDAPGGLWRTKTLSSGQTDRLQAEMWLRRQTGIRVGDLLDQYLMAARRRRVSQAQEHALRAVRRAFGDLCVRELTAKHEDDYRRVTRRHCANGTVRREMGALQAAINWGVTQKLLPIEDRPTFDLPPSGAARVIWLTEPEARAFLADALAFDLQMGVFVALGLNTGARRGAIEALTWDRVDLDKKLVDFRGAVYAPTTKKRRVRIFINPALEAILRQAYAASPAGLGTDRVVGPFGVDGVRALWTRFLRAHPRWAAREVTPHVLRHTFVTLALSHGVSVWDVAGLVGMSADMVEHTYGHHSQNIAAQDTCTKIAIEPELRLEEIAAEF